MRRAVPAARAVAWTQFDALGVTGVTGGWTVDDDTDPTSGQALAEFAGRACYQSWTKPNPATATNAGYLAHILDVAHLSVLEHSTVTFYLTGVSRSFTHELVRHRHFSYSQLSQRYVPEGDAAMVEPVIIADDPELHALFIEAADAALAAYTKLSNRLTEKLGRAAEYVCRCGGQVRYDEDRVGFWCSRCEQFPSGPLPSTGTRKAARQAARAVLPNATETRIVVTGNYRAWRHLIDMRATEHADVEIRAVAVAVLRELQRLAPNVFGDYVITVLPDGTEVATSPGKELS